MKKLASCFTIILSLSGAASAADPGIPIKSRVVGQSMRIVQRACKANLTAYCQQHGNLIPGDTKYEVLGRDPQYDVKCTATCRSVDKN